MRELPEEKEKEEAKAEKQHEVLQKMLAFKDIREEREITEEERKEFYKEFMHSLREVKGDYTENVNDIYYRVKERILLRREFPNKAMKAALDGDDIELMYREAGEDDEKEGKVPYRNAAYWEGVGDGSLKNPFVEGFSHEEGIVTVLGFKKGEDIVENEIEGVQEAQIEGHNYSKDVSLSGTIHRDDLKFLVARIPTKYVDDIEFTEKEKERLEDEEVQYIYRGVYLDTENENEEASHEASS